MSTPARRIGITGGIGVIGALAIVGGVAAAGGSSLSAGPDYRYVASAFDDATARVHVVHTGSEATVVTLHVTGIDAPAGQRFGAHVHQLACGSSATASGGHYQHAGASGTLEDIEIWLDVTVNDGGNGHAQATRPWALDESTPRSVVIHALPTNPDTGVAGARLACIDLDGVA